MNKTSILFFFILVFMTGCQNDDDIVKHEGLSASEMKIYENARTAQKWNNLLAARLISPNSTRTLLTDNENIYQVLFSCNENELDSLYSLYCSPELVEKYDSITDLAWQKLEEITSYKSCAYLLSCVDQYVSSYGHNEKLLAEMIKDQPEIIKTILLKTAANIDQTFDAIDSILLKTRARAEPCLMVALYGAGASGVENEIIKEIGIILSVNPEAEAIVKICELGYDLYSALELVRQYHDCIRGQQ